jgi:hypothetical protein
LPPLHAVLAEHFLQEQIVEIAATVIDMNLWTRLKRKRCCGGTCSLAA